MPSLDQHRSILAAPTRGSDRGGEIMPEEPMGDKHLEQCLYLTIRARRGQRHHAITVE